MRACTSNQAFERDLSYTRKGAKKKKKENNHSLGGNGYKRACFSKLELHLKYAGKNIGKEAGRGNSLHEALYYTDT